MNAEPQGKYWGNGETIPSQHTREIMLKKLHKLKSGNILVTIPVLYGYRNYIMTPDGVPLTPTGLWAAEKLSRFLDRHAA